MDNDSASRGTIDLLPEDHITKIVDTSLSKSPPVLDNRALSDKENQTINQSRAISVYKSSSYLMGDSDNGGSSPTRAYVTMNTRVEDYKKKI